MKIDMQNLPLIPIRGLTIFPYMVMHFDIGRKASIMALEEAMIKEQYIVLSTQLDERIESPSEDEILKIGTLCSIKQILKLPNNNIRVLVEGLYRVEIIKYNSIEPFYSVEIDIIEEEGNEVQGNEVEGEAEGNEVLIKLAKNVFREYADYSGVVANEALSSVEEIQNIAKLSDIICSYLNLRQEEMQDMIQVLNPKERLEKVIVLIKNELEMIKLEVEIGLKVRDSMDRMQKEYFLREQLKVIQEELGEFDENEKEDKEYKAKIKKAKLPKAVKEKALYELERLKSLGSFSSEGGVIQTYLDWLLDIPWNATTKDNLDIKNARKVLDEDHYGIEDVKQRIIEYLAVKNISKSLKGPILCLVGPPGVGKTSIARSIANTIGRNFVRISLGGVTDEADIRGHRKTYVGAMPGRIAYALKQAKTKNPLILLDEIDKMSGNYKGNPADALLEVLDSEQNSSFRDHYLEVDLDLSQILFITTANSLETIPRPLLDRMEIIEVSGYTNEEKFNISKKYLIPKQLKEHTIEDKSIIFSDNAIYYIIDHYTRESGVRSLERNIAAVVRKSITYIVKTGKNKVTINVNTVMKYLGKEKYTFDKVLKEDKIGVVTGMAWTAYGGDTLPVEVATMKGSGKLQLTGQLGDVMKESANAGFSYVRSNSFKYNIDENFYKERDIHIHVPEGAVPKDGPSAGVTMITALVSVLTNTPVRHNVAMTGEISLTGRVLPIGGLKEKTLAAYRAGVDTIIIPKDNEKDLEKVPKTVLSKLKVVIAEHVDTVLNNALTGDIKYGN
ncbi:endopeptidase La [Clostridium cellulovorans]|uniref:Lon protease n=1 Tax=Clostridium cellulovorans (strain ATCC 35296 / DSM 3052 / OCM 3 / 743B) TaxID=573061 RepID=D9SWV6_CLOC7|nr:endopeptidase La [Clostridium cellulovorans]ADL51317.1 ATP-dependent protease La [Clostridium cellulovorans 743B]